MSTTLGSVKRSSWSVSRSGWRTTSTPTTITASCRAMSARARTASRRSRPRPVMLRALRTQAATITAAAIPISQPGRRELGGDRLQVVRNRDRRQRGDDQVVDQDRPAGDEGDQLVEGVAGEARGAAALAEHRAALDVAERGEDEEQAGGEEDQRRQAEAAVGDDAEREVDREADRRVDGDEEAGDAEPALEQRGCGGAAVLGGPCHGTVTSGARVRPCSRATACADPEPAGADRDEDRRRAGCRPRAARRRRPASAARISRPRAMKTNEKTRTEPR